MNAWIWWVELLYRTVPGWNNQNWFIFCQFRDTSIKISRELMKNGKFRGFSEAFMLQVLHQRIKFQPRNFFDSNKQLIQEFLVFVVTYDAVFLQFYLLWILCLNCYQSLSSTFILRDFKIWTKRNGLNGNRRIGSDF